MINMDFCGPCCYYIYIGLLEFHACIFSETTMAFIRMRRVLWLVLLAD